MFPASGDPTVAGKAYLAGIEQMSADLSTTVPLNSYPKASMPSAAPAGQLIYVTDETGGAVPAFSDGVNWRRVTDRAIVS